MGYHSSAHLEQYCRMIKVYQNGRIYPHVTVTSGMSGYFAVLIWWNPEGFAEPYNTGIGRYKNIGSAIAEAKDWAKSEEIPYYD